MAMELITNLIDGHRALLTERGWEITEMVMVKGVTDEVVSGEPNQKQFRKIIAATEFLAKERAFIGAPHPSGSTTATLRSIDPVATTKEKITFRLEYLEYPFENTQINISSNASQEQTNKGRVVHDIGADTVDTVIRTVYTFPTDYTRNPDMAGNTEEAGSMLSKIVPEPTLSVTRKFTSDVLTGGQIISDAAKFVGTVNSDTIAIGGFNYPPLTWLCTDISSTSTDTVTPWGLRVHTVTLSISYRSDKWVERVVFIDPNTGKPPIKDLVDGTGKNLIENAGIKDYLVHKQIEFAGLLTTFKVGGGRQGE